MSCLRSADPPESAGCLTMEEESLRMSTRRQRVPMDPDGSHGSNYLMTKQSWEEEQPMVPNEPENLKEDFLEQENEEPTTVVTIDYTYHLEAAEADLALDDLNTDEVMNKEEIVSSYALKAQALDDNNSETSKNDEIVPTYSKLDVTSATEESAKNDKKSNAFDMEQGRPTYSSSKSEKVDVSNDEKANTDKGEIDVSYSDNLPPKGGVGCLEAWARDGHKLHTLMYVILMISLWIIPDSAAAIAAIVWIIVYIGFLVEFEFSSTRKYLRNVNTTESLISYLGRLHTTAPTLSITINCYHYETRTRTSRDAQGNTVYETYTVPVYTYTEKEDVNITSWEDISPRITNEDVAEYQATKVVLHNTFVADDDYHRQQEALIERNRHRDVHYNLHVGYYVEGYKERLLSYVDLTKKPCMLHVFWAYCAHYTVVFALPFRLWMGSVSGKVETRVHKSLKTSWGASLPADDGQKASASGPEREAPLQADTNLQETTLRTESSFSENAGDVFLVSKPPKDGEVFQC